MSGLLAGPILLLVVFVMVRVWRRRRSGGASPIGPGAAGAMYGFLNEDKRAAIEVIVEQRTGYKDPEDRDGNPHPRLP